MKRKGEPHSKECKKAAKKLKTDPIFIPTR
jgi:hypothetical protein